MAVNSAIDYDYAGIEAFSSHAYLVPVIQSLTSRIPGGSRVLDLGCGNGHISGYFTDRGCTVVGVDPSKSGIMAARAMYTGCRFEVDMATPDLRERLGESPFDLVVSVEVAEHVYDADAWAIACFNALRPGGMLVLTTPYHGYLKNLAIALAGGWDRHHTSLQTGKHIKFWSRETMGQLLQRNGFEVREFRGVGRLPYLWKSMAMSAVRPDS